jgi:sugar phosphate isomerase/epimerase
MKLKLAANTWCYKAMPKNEVIDRLAALKLKGVELIQHGPCHHADLLFTQREIDEQLAYARSKGVRVIAISPGTDFLKFDDDGARQMIEHTIATTELAVRYKVKVSRIFSGGNVPEGRTFDECVAAVVKCLRVAADHAEKRGIRLAIESHGKFGCDLGGMVQILDKVGSPNLGVTLDTANFYSNGVDPIEAIRRITPGRIFHTHLKDITLKGERRGTAVGEGDLDFRAILTELSKGGYAGWYCIEYEGKEDPDTGLRKSIANVKRIAREVP